MYILRKYIAVIYLNLMSDNRLPCENGKKGNFIYGSKRSIEMKYLNTLLQQKYKYI